MPYDDPHEERRGTHFKDPLDKDLSLVENRVCAKRRFVKKIRTAFNKEVAKKSPRAMDLKRLADAYLAFIEAIRDEYKDVPEETKPLSPFEKAQLEQEAKEAEGLAAKTGAN